MQGYFVDKEQCSRHAIFPGVEIFTTAGEKIMLSLVEFEAGAVVEEHSHPHEQAGMVVQGEFDMTIGGETRRLKVGDSYVIPGGVEHRVDCLDGWALALDIFSPPREEYK